jgi:hypothetical protein
VLWIVLDGMGYEHARRCTESGRLAALSKLAEEGYLGPCVPSRPGCQTPSALLTLFSGAEPARSGVWGYRMPHPRRTEESTSGFHAPLGDVAAIWHDMAAAGLDYAIMNVAFRADPVWTGNVPGLRFGYDGYRLWRGPSAFRLGRQRQRIRFRGIDLDVAVTGTAVTLRKGARLRVSLHPGEGKVVELTRGASTYLYLLDRRFLTMSPLAPALVRGGQGIAGAGGPFFDVSAFRFVRGSAGIAVEHEMTPSRESMRRRIDLMLEAMRAEYSRLVVGYFPVIDEFNHAYMHRLEEEWPGGRVSELFLACAGLVDDCLGRVMGEAREGDLVVVSSDHGAVPFRGMLHVNELLAAEGLVRRYGSGYDFPRSRAFYHPSDCGLVVAAAADREAALAGVSACLRRARVELGTEVGMETEEMTPPRLAFLYPLGDVNLTGRPPRRGEQVLDRGAQGGHHLSPLTPTPWIQAMLGLWSPGRAAADLAAGAPRENRDVSRWLFALLRGEG